MRLIHGGNGIGKRNGEGRLLEFCGEKTVRSKPVLSKEREKENTLQCR